MDSRDLLILAGLSGVGLWLYSQQSAAGTGDGTLNADGSVNGSGSGFDFNALIGSMADSITNAVENVVTGSTRGERNNNPGNLRTSINNPWQGQVGTDAAGFCIFDTPENGLRAMFITLNTQIGRGLNTLNSLIPVYSATDQAAYIANVSAWTGIPANAILGPGNISTLAQAMIRMENGDMPYNQDQIAYAANAAGVG